MLRPNFADLDDAVTFCGTAIPESSKPLVLLLMASNMSDLCYRGTPGAFSGGVSDVMLGGRKVVQLLGRQGVGFALGIR